MLFKTLWDILELIGLVKLVKTIQQDILAEKKLQICKMRTTYVHRKC